MKHPRRRDDNEPAIIAALRAIGCSVTQLDGSGVPDLLVGRGGSTFLLEIKHLAVRGGTVRRTSGGARPDDRGLTPTQQAWWAAWRGDAPIIVRTPEEALDAIAGLTDQRE